MSKEATDRLRKKAQNENTAFALNELCKLQESKIAELRAALAMKTEAAPTDLHAAILEQRPIGQRSTDYAEGFGHAINGSAALVANAAPAQTAVAVPEAVKLAGAKMANTMFNLAQSDNYPERRVIYKEMQEEWDAAIRAAHQQEPKP